MDNILLKKEKEFLNNTCSTYKLNGSSQNRVIRDFVIRTFDPFIKKDGKRIGLELGYADGYEAEMLSKRMLRLDVIEGSERFLEKSKERELPNVNFIFSLFENFKSKDGAKYDYVFANYVLEHVIDVDVVLRIVKSVLKPDGLLFVTVPNARAFSRQLSLRMKLIDDLYLLTENDRAHGHRRVYDRSLLNRDLERCGFVNISQGGLMFKILADFQLDKLIDKGILDLTHLNGLYELGLEYPDFAAAIYSICCVKD